jgi:hypothetical protein
MQTEPITIHLTPALYNQLSRLKMQGQFNSDQSLMQAAFEALEREWKHRRDTPVHYSNPYMSHPGLGLDDYDT